MLSKEWIFSLASQLAFSSKRLALRSPGRLTKHRFSQLPPKQGRLRLKYIVEKLLCVPPDDASSCLPSPVRIPAQTHDGDGPFTGLATRCFHWLKKAVSRTSDEANDQDDPGNQVGIDEAEDEMAEFKQLVNSMNLDGIPQYACALRRSMNSTDQPTNFECTIDYSPMMGSFHIIFFLTFNDGVQWLIKIPTAGHAGRWDDPAARSLRSEALTMRMLERKTSIPVPKVFAFESCLDNELGCPFILMERIDGEPLYEKWYDGFASVEAQEQFRERALQSLANATAQLSAIQYPQSGAPSYDDNGDMHAVGPVRVSDSPAMHNRMMEGSSDQNNLFCEIGPFNTAKAYFRSMLEKHRRPTHVMVEGFYELLRMFIDWIPAETTQSTDDVYILAHQDLNLQNILVAEDGTLRGLIDWDGVAMVPRSVGCSYPKWLAFDWDPFHYNFEREIDCECEDRHHSPDEMKDYRALYAHFVQEAISDGQSGSCETAFQLADTTRKSILIGSIDLAAKNPLTTSDIVSTILEKIVHITSQESFKANHDGYSGTIEGTLSLGAMDATSRNEQADHVDEGTSSSRTQSSDLSIPDLPDVSSLAKSSTIPSDLPSEPGQAKAKPSVQHVLESSSSEFDKHPSDRATGLNTRDECKDATKEKTQRRRVASIIQKASYRWHNNAERWQFTKSHNRGSTKTSSSEEKTQSETAHTLSTNFSSLSSDVGDQLGKEEPLPGLTHRAKSDLDHTDHNLTGVAANSTLEADTTANRLEATTQRYGSHYNWHQGAARGQDEEMPNRPQSTSLSSQQETESDSSVQTEGERDGETSPYYLLSQGQPQQKRSLGRRLRARFALHHDHTSHESGSSSSDESREYKDKKNIFGRLASRRKRVIEWVKAVSNTSLNSDSGDKFAVNAVLKTTLPEIPEISSFDMPHPDDPDSRNDVSSRDDCAPGLAAYKHLKLATYDAGEPVDSDKLGDEGFLPAQICYDLMDGTLDEARMHRLKQGFAALLDSL